MQELIRYDPVFLTVFVLLGYKKLFSTSPNTVSSILMLIALSYASSSLVKLAMSSSSSSTRSEDWMHAPEPTDPKRDDAAAAEDSPYREFSRAMDVGNVAFDSAKKVAREAILNLFS
jgi:hypothetical protein